MADHKVYDTPLFKKIGVKSKDKIIILNPPVWLQTEFKKESILFDINNFRHKEYQLIWIFVNETKLLEGLLKQSRKSIVSNGMIWCSWYKKASKKPTTLNEDIIRATALALDLVDIKVASVDVEWSALKLVIPLNKR